MSLRILFFGVVFSLCMLGFCIAADSEIRANVTLNNSQIYENLIIDGNDVIKGDLYRAWMTSQDDLNNSQELSVKFSKIKKIENKGNCAIEYSGGRLGHMLLFEITNAIGDKFKITRTWWNDKCGRDELGMAYEDKHTLCRLAVYSD